MAGTTDTVFAVGDQYWCTDPFLPEPMLGTIIALTDTPGKIIGLQFEEPIGSCGSCDGDGEYDKCLWVLPDSIYNVEEWVSVKEMLVSQAAVRHAFRGNRFKSVTVDSDNRIVVADDQAVEVVTEESDKKFMPASA